MTPEEMVVYLTGFAVQLSQIVSFFAGALTALAFSLASTVRIWR